eukprot:364838-Chlamydomonas_euryale.AAC.8
MFSWLSSLNIPTSRTTDFSKPTSCEHTGGARGCHVRTNESTRGCKYTPQQPLQGTEVRGRGWWRRNWQLGGPLTNCLDDDSPTNRLGEPTKRTSQSSNRAIRQPVNGDKPGCGPMWLAVQMWAHGVGSTDVGPWGGQYRCGLTE